jgi:peptidoglycan/LPS O-acetylase OafA/YrhL
MRHCCVWNSLRIISSGGNYSRSRLPQQHASAGRNFSRLAFVRDALGDLRHPRGTQIPALDALRTLAILMVIAGHFPEAGKTQFPQYARLLDGTLFTFGWTGVDLFFVLSGFLIGRQLWKEQLRTGTINVGRFITRRGFRIWPLYVFIALISPALDDRWSYKWPDWAFLSNYSFGRVEGGWSLSTEEQFYILAPLVILASGRFLRARGWFAVLLASLIAVSGARWWTAHKLVDAGRTLAQIKTAMYTPFHLHSEGLIIGLLLALVSVLAPRLLDGSPEARPRVLTTASIACIVAAMLHVASGTVFPFLSLGMIYGSLMVALLAIGCDTLRLLQARIFYVVSRLSYGMYLNHLAVLRWIAPSVARAVKAVGGQNPLTLFATLGIIVAISALLAVGTFVLIEHPFLVLRERVQYTASSSRREQSGRAPVVIPERVYAFDRIADVKEESRIIPHSIPRVVGSNDSPPAQHGDLL